MKEESFELRVGNESDIKLVIIPSSDGTKINIELLKQYLENNNIFNYDIDILQEYIQNIGEEEIIIELDSILSQSNVDESFDIRISEDNLKCSIIFYSPQGNGKKINIENIIQELRNEKIKYGLDAVFLQNLITDKEYNKEYIIAEGIPCIDGIQGSIKYYFKTAVTSKPQKKDDGSVDYHKLSLIQSVKKNDLLAELTQTIQGKTGKDVYGNVIKPKKVNNVVLKRGKNVILSDDKLKVYAEIDGHVELQDGKINVKNEYFVHSDVDSSTGDVEFEGSIKIKGNVRTGYSIVATGDVEIDGVVEGACIRSEGHVILKRGMQGRGKGKINTKGDVIAKFIENASVKADGNIKCDAILHSTVLARKDVEVIGKKGLIVGGDVRTGTKIHVNQLGSNMETITNISVGINPLLSNEFEEIKSNQEKYRDDLEQIEKNLNILKEKQKNGLLDERKKGILQKLTREKINIQIKNKSNEKRFEEIREQLLNGVKGNVKVDSKVYPGVKITIGDVSRYVREEINCCCFRNDNEEIKISNT